MGEARKTIHNNVQSIISSVKRGEYKPILSANNEQQNFANYTPVPFSPNYKGPATGGGDTPPPSGGEEQVSSSTPENEGITINQAPQPAVATNTNDNELFVEKKRDKEYDEMTVEELEALKKNKTLLPDQLKAIDDEINRKKGTESATKIEGSKTDWDEPKPEDDKFDIQQGDFIEFLMKDIVLASAAWAGKKISGYAGLWMYKGLSKAYHYTTDNLKKGWNAISDSYTEGKNKIKKIIENSGKNKVNQELLFGKDETTAYAKKVIEIHNKDIDQINTRLASRDAAFERFATALFSDEKIEYNTLEGQTVWFDKETRTVIPVDSPTVRKMISQAAEVRKNIGNMPEQERKSAVKYLAQHLSNGMRELTILDAQEKIFSANYACAAMLQSRAEGNPGAENIDAEYRKIKMAEARLIFYSEIKKIKEGTSIFCEKRADGKEETISSAVEKFMAASAEANKTAYESIKDGNIAEKGKIPANKALTKLNSLVNPGSGRQNSDKPQSLIDAALDNDHLAELNQKLDQCLQKCNAAENVSSTHSSRGRTPEKPQNRNNTPGNTSPRLGEGR